MRRHLQSIAMTNCLHRARPEPYVEPASPCEAGRARRALHLAQWRSLRPHLICSTRASSSSPGPSPARRNARRAARRPLASCASRPTSAAAPPDAASSRASAAPAATRPLRARCAARRARRRRARAARAASAPRARSSRQRRRSGSVDITSSSKQTERHLALFPAACIRRIDGRACRLGSARGDASAAVAGAERGVGKAAGGEESRGGEGGGGSGR